MSQTPASALSLATLMALQPGFKIKFTGVNTNSFLKQFELVQDAQGIANDKKAEALPLFLPAEFMEEVCEWDEFKKKDWSALKKKMLSSFNDEETNKYSVGDLKRIAEKQAEKGLHSVYQLKSYNRRFGKVSKWLKKTDRIAWQEESRIYLRAVGKKLRGEWESERRHERRAAAKEDGAVKGGSKLAKVDEIFEDLKAILEDEEAYGRKGKKARAEESEDDSSTDDDSDDSDGDTDYYTGAESGGDNEESDSKDEGRKKRERKTKTKGERSVSKTVSFKEEGRKGGKKEKRVEGSKEVSRQESEKKAFVDAMKDMTQQFGDLRIFLAKAATPAPAPSTYNRSYVPPTPYNSAAAAFPNRDLPPHSFGANSGNINSGNFLPPLRTNEQKCFTCRGPHRFQDVERCEVMRGFISKGIVSISPSGAFLHRGDVLPMSTTLPSDTPTFADWINTRERQHQGAGGGRTAGGTYSASVGHYSYEVPPNQPYEIKTADHFGPEEERMYEVDVGKRTREDGSVGEGGEGRKKMDTRSEGQRRKEYEERAVEEEGIRGREKERSAEAEADEAMTDATSRRKKSTTVLKSAVEGRITKSEVISQVFSTPITLSVEQLLACLPELAKALVSQCQRKRMPLPAEGEVLTYQGDHIQLPDGQQLHASVGSSETIYSAPLGRLNVEIRGSEVLGLVDSGSMITVMGSNLRKQLGLALSESNYHKLSGINGDTVKLAGICKDVPISVGGVVTRHHVFVSPNANTGLVLGVPFLRAINGSITYGLGGEPTLKLTVQGWARTGDPSPGEEEAGSWGETSEEEEDEWEEASEGGGWGGEGRGEPTEKGDEEENGVSQSSLYDYATEQSTYNQDKYVPSTRRTTEQQRVPGKPERVADWVEEVARRGKKDREGGKRRKGEPEVEETFKEEGKVEVEVDGQRFEVYVGEAVWEKWRRKDAKDQQGRKEGGGGGGAGAYRWTGKSPERPARATSNNEEAAEEGGEREREVSVSLNEEEEAVYHVNTAYKPVGKKVLPVPQAFPEEASTKLHHPVLDRDPFETPLKPVGMPKFEYGGRLTKERIDKIKFGPGLTEAERELALAMLRLREKALSDSAEERGCFRSSVVDSVNAVTVDHQAWKDRPLPLPASRRDTIIELLRERLATGLYERSNSAYSSRWFVVEKKNGKLRIVHDLQRLNGVTVRNSGNPPIAEDFIESFAGRASYVIYDLAGGYDQLVAHKELRDKTTFQTPLGPLRLTRLPQGWTNSVAEFQRVMDHIIKDEVPEFAAAFLDDVGVKGPRSKYGDERMKENPEVRRYVWETLVAAERVLYRIEEAGATVGIDKMQLLVEQAEVLGKEVSLEGTSITEGKLNKVANFPEPRNATEMRGFIGLVNYMREFLPDSAELLRPLRELCKKGIVFKIEAEHRDAMEKIKQALGRDILLKKIEYGPDAGKIILSVDSSSTAAGGILWQEDEEEIRRPARYESISFTPTESRYSQPKLELAGGTKMLKRLQYTLWGTHFTLEVDASALIQMINRPEVPNSAMNRWLAFIHLFDFTIKHVPGKSHAFADALSRARRTDDDSEAESLDDLLANVGQYRFEDGGREVLGVYLAEGAYEGEWERIGRYLEMAERPEGMAADAYRRMVLKARKFFLKGGRIYRRKEEGQHQEVVMEKGRREEFLRGAHEETGHRGREETYKRVALRAWWPGVEGEVREWVRGCGVCQRQSTRQEREKGRISLPAGIIDKWHFDCAYLKQGSYIVEAKDDLTGWSEAKSLKKLTSKNIAEWVNSEILARFGQFRLAVVDGGSEFKDQFADLLRKAGISRVVIAPYHPEANGRIERAHQSIIAYLAKACRSLQDVKTQLPLALLADRISTSRASGYSPYELLYGARPILPIDMTAGTWLTQDWESVCTREDLLKARVELLERKPALEEDALRRLRRSREQSLAYYDKVNAHRLRLPLQRGQLVLVINQLRLDTHGGKLSPRWHGPFRVVRRLEKGSYLLSELDGAIMGRAFASKRLKRFWTRGRDEADVEGEELEADVEALEAEEEEADNEEARKLAREEADRFVEEQRRRREATMGEEEKRRERRKDGRRRKEPKFWVEVPRRRTTKEAGGSGQLQNSLALLSPLINNDLALSSLESQVAWEERA